MKISLRRLGLLSDHPVESLPGRTGKDCASYGSFKPTSDRSTLGDYPFGKPSFRIAENYRQMLRMRLAMERKAVFFFRSKLILTFAEGEDPATD
jgi:hypothetical protein